MAKLRTLLFVLLTIAEIIGSKSPPTNEHEEKDKEPRLAYFLGSRSTARAPIHRNVVDTKGQMAHQANLVKENMVSKTVDKELINGTGLIKKNATSRHCDHCKCTTHKRLPDFSEPFGKRNRRETTIQLGEHLLNQNTTQEQQQITVKNTSDRTTMNPSKAQPDKKGSKVNPPASSSERKPFATSSEVPLVSAVHVGNTSAANVAQTQLREEEDEEDTSDYQDPVARLSHCTHS